MRVQPPHMGLHLPKLGLSRPPQERLRYQRPRLGSSSTSEACTAVLEAMRQTARDQRDRNLLVWPCRSDNGFMAAALHLLEGRVQGFHATQTIGLWPWRGGIVHTSKSVLVEPDTLVRYARAAAQDRANGVPWTREPFGGDAHEMVHLRLDDLKKEPRATKSGIEVRLPSLFELTSFFEPTAGTTPYVSDLDHFLNRVRRYTQINVRRGLTARYAQALGDPALSPLAVFGLPSSDDKTLARCLSFERFGRSRLDAVIVDLTRTAVNALGDNWPAALARLLVALDRLGAARPGVVVLAEDVFVHRKAEGVLREAAQATRPHRPMPEPRGVMLRAQGFLGDAAPDGMSYPAMDVHADLKDGRLLTLRKDVLEAARSMEEAEDRLAAAALRTGLLFVRSTANLPVGLGQARSIVETMHATEDEADRAVRRKFFVSTALQPLTEAASASVHRETLLSFRLKFKTLAEGWENGTPVSEKLVSLARKLGEGARDTMLVLPDRHVVNLYSLSDAAMSTRWHVAEPRSMLEVASMHGCEHWIVVRPSNETLRTLLTVSPGPRRIDLIGDAAGTALLQAELKPISALDAFAALRARATNFLKAIGQSVSSFTTDYDEIHARVATLPDKLDFTRSGGEYTGPRVRLVTEGGYVLLYRPLSEVLRHTPDDLRAFDKVDARSVQPLDTILVLTPGLMELLRRELARAPRTVETLRKYHGEVGRRCQDLPGLTLRDKARSVVCMIQAAHPEFQDSEVGNVTRWLGVDLQTLDDPSALPQAPRTRQRFGWFMEALKVVPALADAWWLHGILLTRSYRMSEGMQFNQRAVDFISDPESFTARTESMNAALLEHAVTESTGAIVRAEIIYADRG